MPAQESWLQELRVVSERGEQTLAQVPGLLALIEEWWEQPGQFCAPWQTVGTPSAIRGPDLESRCTYRQLYDRFRSLLAQFGR